jgi:carbamoyl-phosphate synthase small subunit
VNRHFRGVNNRMCDDTVKYSNLQPPTSDFQPPTSNLQSPISHLALADGTVFSGRSFGAPGTVTGEVVFNTSLTGYQEILTDPSYCGQIVVMTNPHIGNVGINPEDFEAARPWVTALVVREASRRVSNWRATQSLPDYLAQNAIPGLTEVDTRALVRHIRAQGAMLAALSSDPALSPDDLVDLARSAPSMVGRDLVQEVTCREAYSLPRGAGDGKAAQRAASLWDSGGWGGGGLVARDLSRSAPPPLGLRRRGRQSPPAAGGEADFPPPPDGRAPRSAAGGSPALHAGASVARAEGEGLHVVAYDFGIKHSILYWLVASGCRVTIVPATTPAAEALALQPDGIFLSNGPGDPAAVTYAIQATRDLIASGVPMFGICLGHQIIGLALGGQTYKLKFGHRGGNQPVRDAASGRVQISAHNHGFAVLAGSLPADVEVTHVNLNDGCVEGLRAATRPVFSVQYHPEASPGPHDALPLFAEFVEEMKKGVRSQK